MQVHYNGITGKFVLSDQALVLKLAGGDQRALAVLFERFGRVVRSFLLRMRGTDDQDLDDLVQTTFLELTRAASTFEGRSEVSTWVFGIAANVVRHHVRRERRRRDYISQLAKLPARAPPRPDDVAEQRRYLRRLEAAVRKLSPDLRIAYVVCAVHQVPGKDAARELGLPLGTLSRRVCEARRQLARAIGWHDGIDEMARALRSHSYL